MISRSFIERDLIEYYIKIKFVSERNNFLMKDNIINFCIIFLFFVKGDFWNLIEEDIL